jgi:RNA polymerase sigma-70 factor (ECF subfamily)
VSTDEGLYERLRQGDASAFDELYARYEVPLFGFLLSQLRSRADAEDAFHEAFLRALTSKEIELRGPGSLRAWLFRVARNEAANRLRGARRRGRAEAQLPRDASVPAADQMHDGAELSRALDAAVERLPSALAELYHLRASGLRYEEIAVIVEVPVGTIKSRMHKLVALLKEECSPWIAQK